jgi:tRNA threonylcarbamoyladenosine biosynthesis protein TsaB
MIVLGFDTATRATTVALWDGLGEPVEGRDDPPPGERPSHATRLLPLAVQLLDGAEVGWRQVDLIAVGVGPGTFTGLRIGVATARALGHALRVPLAGVSTLRSLAMNVRRAEVVLSVLDARRSEVFAAAWRGPEVEGGREPLLAPRACTPDWLAEAVEELGSAPLTVGDGAVEFRKVLERSGAVIPEDDSELHRVSAANHCRLAPTLDAMPPDAINPEYLRVPDAEVSRRATRSV